MKKGLAAAGEPTGCEFQHTHSQLVLLDAETRGPTILLTHPLGYVHSSQDYEKWGPGGTEESAGCVGEKTRELVSGTIQHRMLAALMFGWNLKAPMCNRCLMSKVLGCCQHQSRTIRFLQKHSASWDSQPIVFIFQPTWYKKTEIYGYVRGNRKFPHHV